MRKIRLLEDIWHEFLGPFNKGDEFTENGNSCVLNEDGTFGVYISTGLYIEFEANQFEEITCPEK